jgi:hypothetical protein
MARSQGEAMDTDQVTTSGPPPAGPDRRRALLISLAAVVALTALAAGVWWMTTLFASPRPDTRQSAELTALDGRLKAVRAAITPIASSFATESADGAINVASFRDRIAAARRLVDEVNGLEVTGADALQVRDQIVTGGSEVLAGLDMALDALVSNDATATTPAAVQVEEGLQQLQEARDTLDRLLGRTSLTLLRSRAGVSAA